MFIIVGKTNPEMFWTGKGWVNLARNAKRYTSISKASMGEKAAKKRTTAETAVERFIINIDDDWYRADEDWPLDKEKHR